MNRRSTLVAIGCVSVLLGACNGTVSLPPPATSTVTPSSAVAASSAPTATPEPTASPVPSQSPPPACPNPHGGQCLGPLAAGTYSTVTFRPTISYTVPAGWGNYEDLPGNFLLIPPGGSLAGVDAGTSDYLGIYSSIALDAPCTGPAPNVHGAELMAAFLSRQPEFATSNERAVSVGRLSGSVLDIRIAKTWKTACLPGPLPNAFLMSGLPPSDFDHGLVGKLAIRLYLLNGLNDDPGEVLAIEVDDISGGGHLNGYETVVKSLGFTRGE